LGQVLRLVFDSAHLLGLSSLPAPVFDKLHPRIRPHFCNPLENPNLRLSDSMARLQLISMPSDELALEGKEFGRVPKKNKRGSRRAPRRLARDPSVFGRWTSKFLLASN
jgi:hypothetical protein